MLTNRPLALEDKIVLARQWVYAALGQDGKIGILV
jgi:hypothetical protein